MSYTPTEWKTGDVVTSAKLNKIEQGIAAGGGVLIVGATDGTGESVTLDKTWQEIYDSDFAVVCISEISGSGSGKTWLVPTFVGSEPSYVVVLPNGESTLTFATDSADGYPVYPPVNPDAPDIVY